MRVYAGVDPVTKRRHDLIEVVPPGPHADKIARATRDRLVNEVAERRNPRTSATVGQLLDRYLDQFDGAPNTLTLYRGYVRNHLSPFLGRIKVASSTPRRWMRSMPSCAGAAPTATAAACSRTARASPTSVTRSASYTCAGRSVRRRSGTCTSSCPARTSGRSAGGGYR